MTQPRFILGKNSVAKLQGVHPRLVAVVREAITITPVDFAVHAGRRTVAEQRQMVARGVSKTMNSNHLVKADGLGWAVDLVPWVDGALTWDWKLTTKAGQVIEPFFHIAAAMRAAAIRQGTPLVWGGVWDRRLADLPATAPGLKQAMADYGARRRRIAPGKSVLYDGPHFELKES